MLAVHHIKHPCRSLPHIGRLHTQEVGAMLKHVLFGLVAVGLVMVGFGRAADEKEAKKPIDEEGFIKSWLILAPIPFAEGQNHGDAVEKEKIKDEAKLEPKDGDKVKVGDKELTWKAHMAETHLIDFNKILGETKTQSVGYAVAYIVADGEKKDVVLKIGSDDGCKLFLNGKEVGKVVEERAADKDQNSFDKLTLKKGRNVLVFKIVNAEIDWSGCARFTDAEGKPVKGLTTEEKK